MATAAATFVPEVIAAGIEKNLNPAWVFVDGCNKSYEGSIKRQGDTVKIRTVGRITAHSIARSAKRGALSAAEEIDGAFLTLPIDQIVYTNTFVDSIDELATDVSLMDATTKEMATALASAHDEYVAELVDGSTVPVVKNGSANWALTTDNILDMILKAKTALKEKNIPETAPLELIITPEIEPLLIKKQVLAKTNNVADYTNGKVGTTLGVSVKVSNNVYSKMNEGGTAKVYDACCLRVRDKAMAFAQQISKVIHYRDDVNKLDMDFIKSYSLFGAKVLFPDYMVKLPVASVTL